MFVYLYIFYNVFSSLVYFLTYHHHYHHRYCCCLLLLLQKSIDVCSFSSVVFLCKILLFYFYNLYFLTKKRVSTNLWNLDLPGCFYYATKETKGKLAMFYILKKRLRNFMPWKSKNENFIPITLPFLPTVGWFISITIFHRILLNRTYHCSHYFYCCNDNFIITIIHVLLLFLLISLYPLCK